MAGCVGVAPWSYTYGELSLMSQGVERVQWWHTASILSKISAAFGVAKPPEAFHPFELERHRPKTKQQLEDAAEARAIVARADAAAIAAKGVR